MHQQLRAWADNFVGKPLTRGSTYLGPKVISTSLGVKMNGCWLHFEDGRSVYRRYKKK